MSANIVVSGKIYNGVDTISVKDTQNTQKSFLLQGETPPAPLPIVEKDVNFYDYDGSLVASYTASDFANLTAMPANPTHTGLVAQGWNWSLADAKTYVETYRKLIIGQMYATASGKTEYDIEVNEATGFTATLGLSGTEKDWGDGTVDTNTSHTYAAAGNYTIKLSGTTLPTIQSSKKLIAVRIANGATITGTYPFCYKIKHFTMPESILKLGTNDDYLIIMSKVINFYTCSINAEGTFYHYGAGLKKISINKKITTIPDLCFLGSCLESITLPSNITTIGGQSFQSCEAMNLISIPENVNSIKAMAFSSSSTLTIITIFATTPPTLAATNAIPSSVTKIYIPNGTLATYQGASNWSNFSALFVEMSA